jgi:hypothetical protein
MRDVLKETIRASIPDVMVYDTVPEVSHLPAVVIEPLNATSSSFRNGLDTWIFDFSIMVARQETSVSQNTLDDLLDGPGSVPKILYSASLDDLDVYVQNMHGYGGSHPANGLPHIGAVLRVKVTRT